MYQDVFCPYCKMSLISYKVPFTDNFECPTCHNMIKLTIGVINWIWMWAFTLFFTPITFLVLIILKLTGWWGYQGSWGEIFLYSFIFVPGSFLLIGFISIGFFIAVIVKLISGFRQ
jgi:hypothetical protein